jgi:TRAP-type C4-dicarboxylate transport system permease small subunit
MNRFVDIVRRITTLGTGLGAAFLAGIMVLIAASIITSFFGRVIPGSYDLIELMIVVTVAFSLSHSGIKRGHVAVKIIVELFPGRVQDIIAGFTNFISMIFWGVVAWAAYKISFEKGILEVTNDLLIPYMPFRFTFAFGLLLLAIVFFIEMVKALKRGLKR